MDKKHAHEVQTTEYDYLNFLSNKAVCSQLSPNGNVIYLS